MSDRTNEAPSTCAIKRVLFVCTHNSARSQMAEGLLRALGSDRFIAVSAGTVASRVRPEAVAVMAEVGLDIGEQRSKTVEDVIHDGFDIVVTVCDDAKQSCPFVPGISQRLHWSIDDPSRVEGSAELRLEAFRSARDELKRRIETELF